MVIALGALKEGNHAAVRGRHRGGRAACRGQCLKVIIETCLLDEAGKRLAAPWRSRPGADFVKTSTGFSTRRRHTWRIVA